MTTVPPPGEEQNPPAPSVVVAAEGTPAGIPPSEKKVQTCCRRRYPPGFHFMPSDSELILDYLKRKILNLPIPISEISEVNLYRYTPEYLAASYPPLGETGWYFFTPRDRKYRNGSRPNRAADTGFWKATGADKAVSRDGKVVGSRKALVFYEGRPPKGKKTNWIMHEYRVVGQPPRSKRDANDMRLDDWVLCRIHKKLARPGKNQQRRNTQQDDQELMDPIQDHEQPLQSESEQFLDNSDSLAVLSIHDNAATPSPHQFVDNHENLAALPMAEDNVGPPDPLDEWIQTALSGVDNDPCAGNFSFQSNDDPQTSFGYSVPNPFGQLQDDPFRTKFLHEEQQWGFHDHLQQDDHQWWGMENPGNFQNVSPYYAPSSSSGGGFTDSFIKNEGPGFKHDAHMMINNVPDDHNQTVPRKNRRIV